MRVRIECLHFLNSLRLKQVSVALRMPGGVRTKSNSNH